MPKIITPNSKHFSPELTKFLSKNNMLDKAIKYATNVPDSHNDLFPGPKPNLHWSFLWMNTEEGYMFWKDLSDKFMLKND